jgi:hypothetical protein
VRPDAVVDPGGGVGEVRRVRGEPLAQLEACGERQRREVADVRPGALGVDVVGGQRADATPVVDTGAHQQAELLRVGEVRRCLDRRVGTHHHAGHGHGRDVLLQLEVGVVLHRRPGLRPEVLHDGLLHVAVPLVRGPDGEQRLGALGVVLPDAQQHAGGEGDLRASGVLEDPQAQRRVLVGGAVVHPALLGPQARRGGLEHHAHRRRDRAQALQLGPRHHPGVEVRQQAGLLEDQDRHGTHVLEGRAVAVLVEPRTGGRPAVLGAVTEGEQRLLAAEGGTGPGDLEDVLGLHERLLPGRPQAPGGLDEHAVVAAVAAELGEGDEHLLGVGDDAGAAGALEPLVTDPGGEDQQPLELVAARSQQEGRVVLRRRPGLLGPGQGRVDRIAGHSSSRHGASLGRPGRLRPRSRAGTCWRSRPPRPRGAGQVPAAARAAQATVPARVR